ncbi:hypothetical protein OPV22_022504 [Ensete ventricosum]|uniref:SnoaL-like domain-containing protein n=1 Tax=Ensete ventricosum TaxID=4639 RepID=A0AAV8QT16_ENSVE|nr:hypothetical protein OPV22_022504 [Ensete ventricosum]
MGVCRVAFALTACRWARSGIHRSCAGPTSVLVRGFIKARPPARHRLILLLLLSVAPPSRESFRVRASQEGEGGRSGTGARHELANGKGESVEDRNKWAVLTLYEALNARDVERVQQLLAPDIEWWFHGPPEHQHMMRMLTGADEEETAAAAFRFQPERVAAFGSTVVAEGSAPDAAWVHAWTVAPDGIITQVREYFNTSLTITRVAAASSASSKEPAGSTHCLPLWQSRRPDPPEKSFPGLVLAI